MFSKYILLVFRPPARIGEVGIQCGDRGQNILHCVFSIFWGGRPKNDSGFGERKFLDLYMNLRIR